MVLVWIHLIIGIIWKNSLIVHEQKSPQLFKNDMMTNYAPAQEHFQQDTHTDRRMRLQSNLKQTIPIINFILLSFYECVDPILNSPI